MAQAGIHALFGAAMRKVVPKMEWVLLGVLLGSIFPDLDNFGIAIATVTKWDTQGIHRTFTHSLFTILVAVAVFTIYALVRKQRQWKSFGVGFGFGIGLHILLDLILWFNGVELLWPFGGWVNLWAKATLPTWFTKFMDPAEFLFLALFFIWLGNAAKIHKTDTQHLKTLRIWIIAMVVLLVIFTPLAYLMSKGFQTIYGAFYLISLTAAFIITIQMRKTVEVI